MTSALEQVRIQIAMCEWQIGSCLDALPRLRDPRKVKRAKTTIREAINERRGLKRDEAALAKGKK